MANLRECLCRLELTLLLVLATMNRDHFTEAFMSYGSMGNYASPCVAMSECGSEYCCAYKSRYRLGFCMPQKKLGEICTNSFLLGKTFACGCARGLTCAIVEKDQLTGYKKFRCVQIPQETTERQENLGASRTITKLLTADELRRMMRLLKQKSKIDEDVTT